MWWSLLEKCRNHCQVAFFFWLFISGGREPEEEGQLGRGWFARELEKHVGGTQASWTVLGPAGWQPTHFSLRQFSLTQAHSVVTPLDCALTPYHIL